MQTARILLFGGILSAPLGLALLGLCASPAASQKPDPHPARLPAKRESPTLVAGYKKWPRVNPKPVQMASVVATMCADPSPQLIQMEAGNPHNDKFITVYVNPQAKQAMLREKAPHFPKGSVLVKEKLKTENSETPELMTVMRKRERGFDPQHGDWEYFVLDGDGKRIQAQGKLEKCQTCHAQYRQTDYVVRSYLPWETRKALK